MCPRCLSCVIRTIYLIEEYPKLLILLFRHFIASKKWQFLYLLTELGVTSHTLTHTLSLSHFLSHTLVHTHTLLHTFPHTHVHTHSLSHTFPLLHTLSYTHTLCHFLSHTLSYAFSNRSLGQAVPSVKLVLQACLFHPLVLESEGKSVLSQLLIRLRRKACAQQSGTELVLN